MATAEQLKTLILSHYEHNEERFNTVALQMAAYEAHKGHTRLASDIRDLIDKEKGKKTRIIPLNTELQDLILYTEGIYRLSDLIASEAISNRIKRILREYKKQEKLKQFGLENRRKILLCGPPGTGKTMTAKVLAGELHLPLFIILMDKIVTKYMGETSAKLRQVFNIIDSKRGIYLFDEFDAIGAERGRDNDVGEMRRVLNSFLQFIDQDSSDSIIVAATNNVNILDQALFRRFTDIIHYKLPVAGDIENLIKNRLGKFKAKTLTLAPVIEKANSLSHAEICGACDDAIKETILNDKRYVTEDILMMMLEERQSAYHRTRH